VSGDSNARATHARALFAPLGPTYDHVGAALSLGQDPLWRRFLVSRLPRDGGRVLDVATGTSLVARALVERGFHVTGLDQSPEMLDQARRRLPENVELVLGRAEALPFPDASFDHLTFTYLLRYVDDPAATLRELARVVRPGGTIASLEFGVPDHPWRLPWEVYVRTVLPFTGLAVRRGWQEIGAFLPASIRQYAARFPLSSQRELWRLAGIQAVRARRLSLGAAVVISGVRE
jgi:demethylmenaquinone methyltransferase / 2-methoxy-6-polyprenyl-1,4-benzoquinol methylase